MDMIMNVNIDEVKIEKVSHCLPQKIFLIKCKILFVQAYKARQITVDKNVIIGVIYRPSNTCLENFTQSVENMLFKIHKECKIC